MGQVSVVLKIHAVSYPLHKSLWFDYDNHFLILELDIIIIIEALVLACSKNKLLLKSLFE